MACVWDNLGEEVVLQGEDLEPGPHQAEEEVGRQGLAVSEEEEAV